MDRDALSASQQEALGQLLALMNGGDTDVATSVLESVGWDVQRAADAIFDTNPSAPLSISQPHVSSSASAPARPEPPRSVETFDVDDSEQHGLLNGRPTGRQFDRVAPANNVLAILMRPLRFIIALLAVPYTLLRVILRGLGVPLPLPPLPPAFSITGLGLNVGLPSRAPPPVRDAKVTSERWVRALEEETGCVSVSRAQVPVGEASGVASGSGSISARRTDSGEAQTRVLPDFFIGSYESFVRTLAKEDEARVGCVVLVSEEHDDVAEFKRSTLTDPEFVRLIKDNDFLVWGGDIRDRDPWSAAQKLQATTYPFVAFIALQSRRGVSSSSSSSSPPSPVLTVLSRHFGPSIPTSTAPTSAHTLTTHLTTHLLPRVTPYLTTLRRSAVERESLRLLQARERDRERSLREEQDRAFAESARRDKDRIERKMQEEKEARLAAIRQAEEEERRAEEQKRAEEAKEKWEAERMAWRRWGRRALLPREPRPGEQGRGKTVRVGVRMPDGKRAVRFFGESDSLTAVYAFIDAQFIPSIPEFSSSLDPTAAPNGEDSSEEGLLHAMEKAGKKNGAWWGFKLALAYPRREIHWEPGKRVGEVEGLSGGQLAVELYEDPAARRSLDSARSRSNGSGSASGGAESDEYETESD